VQHLRYKKEKALVGSKQLINKKDLTTRINEIFVLFIEFYVVRQPIRNKDAKKMKRKKKTKRFL